MKRDPYGDMNLSVAIRIDLGSLSTLEPEKVDAIMKGIGKVIAASGEPVKTTERP